MHSSTHPTQSKSSQKWLLLVLGMLTNTLVSAAPMMCLPVLFPEIAADLNLSLVQLGMVWGISSLPGIVTMLLGGAVGDHFGPKRILVISCLLVGLTGALRGTAGGFASLAAAMFLFGMFAPFITLNTFKAVGMRFPPHQLGFASGVLSMGMALGFLLSSMFSATLLSPLLGGWRNVVYFYGAVSLLFAVPWFFTQAEPAGQKDAASAPVAQAAAGFRFALQSLRNNLGKMLRIRNLWLYGLVIFGFGGCVQGALGYLPLYLRGQGWAETSADGALAMFHTVSMIAVIPIALLSDRLRTRKKILVIAALMMALGVGVLSAVDGILVWAAVIFAGIVRDGFMAVFMTQIMETEGVGPAYAGTAVGMVFMFSGVGNLLAPPVGNSLASISPGSPFLFWAALAILGLAGLVLTAERRPQPALGLEV